MSQPAQVDGDTFPFALVARSLVPLLVLAFMLSWGRAVIESHRYFSWGETAQSEQDWESAVIHYRHALQWHAPILSRSEAAFDALVVLGDQLAAEDDTEAALVAYRSARAGVMSIRHVRVPFVDRLPALHQKIGALMAAQGGNPGREARELAFTEQLDAWRDRQPNPLVASLASLMFIGWIVALFWLAAKGFRRDGSVDGVRFARGVVGVAVCLITWLCLVRLA